MVEQDSMSAEGRTCGQIEKGRAGGRADERSDKRASGRTLYVASWLQCYG